MDTELALSVKMLSGEDLAIKVSSCSTLSDVKQKIFEAKAVPPSLQQLVLEGDVLDAGSSLAQIDIADGASLQLVIRDKPMDSLIRSLVLENVGDAEARFDIQARYPFNLDIEQGIIPPHRRQEILVSFDPAFEKDPKNGTIQQKLIVSHEHIAVSSVE